MDLCFDSMVQEGAVLNVSSKSFSSKNENMSQKLFCSLIFIRVYIIQNKVSETISMIQKHDNLKRK